LEAQAIPFCPKASWQGKGSAWLNGELCLELGGKKRRDSDIARRDRQLRGTTRM